MNFVCAFLAFLSISKCINANNISLDVFKRRNIYRTVRELSHHRIENIFLAPRFLDDTNEFGSPATKRNGNVGVLFKLESHLDLDKIFKSNQDLILFDKNFSNHKFYAQALEKSNVLGKFKKL